MHTRQSVAQATVALEEDVWQKRYHGKNDQLLAEGLRVVGLADHPLAPRLIEVLALRDHHERDAQLEALHALEVVAQLLLGDDPPSREN